MLTSSSIKLITLWCNNCCQIRGILLIRFCRYFCHGSSSSCLSVPHSLIWSVSWTVSGALILASWTCLHIAIVATVFACLHVFLPCSLDFGIPLSSGVGFSIDCYIVLLQETVTPPSWSPAELTILSLALFVKINLLNSFSPQSYLWQCSRLSDS